MFKKLQILESKLFDSIEKNHLFNDDINILWGRNAIGKSLLLQAISLNGHFYGGFLSGGWSNLIKKDDSKTHYLYNTISIEWSGMPVFYINYETMYDRRYILMGGDHLHGVEDSRKVLFSSINNTPSEVGLNLFNYLTKVTKKDYPNSIISETSNQAHASNSYKNIKDEIKMQKEVFINKYPNSKLKPTLLIDQIDMGFDLYNQELFFSKTIKKLKKKFQIIMITNSIFALNLPIIELDNSMQELNTIL